MRDGRGHYAIPRKRQCPSYYEEASSALPLLAIPGGGLNSTISYFAPNFPFNAIKEFKGDYRCISMDLRNANGGRSCGP